MSDTKKDLQIETAAAFSELTRGQLIERMVWLERELHKTQGAIEELSIGVWPDGWRSDFVAVHSRWPVGVDANEQVQWEEGPRQVAVRPDRIRGLFEMVRQKIGGMNSYSQSCVMKRNRLYLALRDLLKGLDPILGVVPEGSGQDGREGVLLSAKGFRELRGLARAGEQALEDVRCL